MSILIKYVSLIPEYSLAVLCTCVIFILFSGFAFVLFKDKISILHLGITYYLVLALFVLIANIAATILPNALIAIVGSFVLLSGVSCFLWLHHKKNFIFDKKILTFLLTITCLMLSLFLFNFGYRNGLHDDYFHHAVVQLFFKNNAFPFMHPYVFNETISSFYHYGLYFVVIAMKVLTATTVETAIDWSKILLFLPAPLVIGLSLKKLLKGISDVGIVLLILALFLSAPSFFLRDSFFLFLAQIPNTVQFFMPLLYEFAGITWLGFLFGQIYFLTLVLVSYKEIRISKIGIISFIISSLIGLQFINQAFYLVLIFQLLIFLLLQYKTTILSVSSTHRIGFLSVTLMALISGLIALTQFTTSREALTSLLSSLTSEEYAYGIPYASSVLSDGIQIQTQFLPITDMRFFRSAGLVWFIALLLFLFVLFKNKTYRKNNFVITLAITSFVIPVAVYFIHPPSLDLAINKLLYPAVFSSLLLLYLSAKELPLVARAVLYGFIFLGVINPTRFFIVNQGEGLQRFWSVSDSNLNEIITYINHEPTKQLITTNNQNLTYIIANTTNSQVVTCFETCPASSLRVIDKNKDYNISENSIYENSDYLLQKSN